jgi:hypothetical protein
MEKPKTELLNIKGIGDQTLQELEKFLNEHGFTYEKFERDPSEMV